MSHAQVYVTDTFSHTVVKAGLDGTGVATLISSGLTAPYGLVATASHLYIANLGTDGTDGSVVRFDLNGGDPTTLVSGLYNPNDVEIAGNSMYVLISAAGSEGLVQKYDLNGVPDGSFTPVTGLNNAVGIAVSSTHLFVSNAGTGEVFKYNLDGTGGSTIISGLNGSFNLMAGAGPAVLGDHLYVSRRAADNLKVTIGKYDLSGNVVNDELILPETNGFSTLAAAGTRVYATTAYSTYVEYDSSDGELLRSTATGPAAGVAVLAQPELPTVTIGQYLGLTITGTVGAQYIIEYTTSLDEPVTWTPLETITLPGSPYLYIDTNIFSGTRFYRVVLP